MFEADFNYRFSPIDRKEQFDAALKYISSASALLVQKVCGVELPVSVLKLFAHSKGEHDWLVQYINQFGTPYAGNSANSYYVEVNTQLHVGNTAITLIGVRRPDPDWPEVGAGDCIDPNYPTLGATLTAEQSPYVTPIYKGEPTELTMYQLMHPDFDVRAFLIPQ